MMMILDKGRCYRSFHSRSLSRSNKVEEQQGTERRFNKTELAKSGGKIFVEKDTGDSVGRTTNARGVNSVMLCPVYTNGNKTDCSNWQGISLLSSRMEFLHNELLEISNFRLTRYREITKVGVVAVGLQLIIS